MRSRAAGKLYGMPLARKPGKTGDARLEVKVEDCSNSVHLPVGSAARVIMVLKIPLDLSIFGNGKGQANGQRGSTPFAKSADRDLELWLESFSNDDSGAWLFPSEKATKPIRKDNVWRRYIKPKLKGPGLSVLLRAAHGGHGGFEPSGLPDSVIGISRPAPF